MQMPGFWGVFGFDLEAADASGAVLRMDVPDALMSPFGQVHGGVIAALFDTGLAVAVTRHLAPEDRVATHTLTVSYLNFTREQVLRCRARVVDLKRSVATVEGEVVAASGTLVAKAIGVFGVHRRGVSSSGSGAPPGPPG